MLKTILAISGKPGLYKFISRGKNMLIVETLDAAKTRQPAYATDRVVSLSDISIYTNDDKEVPLSTVFQNIQREWDGKAVEALLEEKVICGADEYYTGYTREYIRVHVKSDTDLTNRVIRGRLDCLDPEMTILVP